MDWGPLLNPGEGPKLGDRVGSNPLPVTLELVQVPVPPRINLIAKVRLTIVHKNIQKLIGISIFPKVLHFPIFHIVTRPGTSLSMRSQEMQKSYNLQILAFLNW